MSDSLGGIGLRIGVFRFTIAPLEPLAVPAVNKANMLRGGFGHAFRRLCCVPQCGDAKACPLENSCPYKAVFEPSPPPGADRLSKNQDIPRPFVFRAPQDVAAGFSPAHATPSPATAGPGQAVDVGFRPAGAAPKSGATTRYEPGERFEFGLVLIGRALDFLPYFVLSFRELAQEGLGLNRAKCSLERVEELKPPLPEDSQLGEGAEEPQSSRTRLGGSPAPSPCNLTPVPYSLSPVPSNLFPVPSHLLPVPYHQSPVPSNLSPATSWVYSCEDQLFRATGSCSADQWIKTRLRMLGNSSSSLFPVTCSLSPGPVTRHSSLVTVSFLTPTFLRADGEVVRRSEFHHVFKRLRDRINALNTFFGGGPLDVDFRGLGERAEKVRTVSARTDWVERFRTSSKTHQRHELSGFVGECTYDFSSVDGNLSPVTCSLAPDFMPWLALGELLHVGKHTAASTRRGAMGGTRLEATRNRRQVWFDLERSWWN